jgi:orotidine-5'-phosphate decarboxylase
MQRIVIFQDQRYTSPRGAVLERGADLIIVGRGITGASDPAGQAERYRQEAWQAYLARTAQA